MQGIIRCYYTPSDPSTTEADSEDNEDDASAFHVVYLLSELCIIPTGVFGYPFQEAAYPEERVAGKGWGEDEPARPYPEPTGFANHSGKIPGGLKVQWPEGMPGLRSNPEPRGGSGNGLALLG